jgi:hypothetical protein
MNKIDLVNDIIGDRETTDEEKALFLKNLEEAMETFKDERLKCILKKRYFEELTLKKCGLSVVNYTPEQSHKRPCDGLTKERARYLIKKAIWILRHPIRQRILRGEYTAKEYFALYGDKRG